MKNQNKDKQTRKLKERVISWRLFYEGVAVGVVLMLLLNRFYEGVVVGIIFLFLFGEARVVSN